MKIILLSLLLLALLAIIFTASSAQAQQDFKHAQGLVTQEGKVISSEGRLLGWVTREGIISDSAGTKIAHIDKEGNLIEHPTGKKLGKVQRNGNYQAYGPITADQEWKVSHPINGTCEVKNSKAEIVALIHESHRQHGAAAFHYLSLKYKEKVINK